MPELTIARSCRTEQLIRFLQHDLAVSEDAIEMALRQGEAPNLLPMVLWQYGLITLGQLDQIFEWMERSGD
jgi:Protein of unknown function (DUF2949)